MAEETRGKVFLPTLLAALLYLVTALTGNGLAKGSRRVYGIKPSSIIKRNMSASSSTALKANNIPPFCSVESFRSGSWWQQSNATKRNDTIITKDGGNDSKFPKGRRQQSEEQQEPEGPLFQNLSCPFENLAHSCYQSLQLEKANTWSTTAWIPTENCRKRSFSDLFLTNQKNNRTILFYGDSMARQTFVAFACSLSPHYLVSYHVDWLPSKAWCNKENWCFQNQRANDEFGGYYFAQGDFRWGDTVVRLAYADSEVGAEVLRDFVNATTNTTLSSLSANSTIPLSSATTINHSTRTVLISEGPRGRWGIKNLINQVIGSIVQESRRNDGDLVDFVYQEVAATHFPTPDGAYIRRWQRRTGTSKCTPIRNVSLAYSTSLNRRMEQIMQKANVSILRVWNATQQAGPTSHVGLNVDCRHFCNPGVPIMFAEQFLHYVLRKELYSTR